jgi:glyoxylase I family protein
VSLKYVLAVVPVRDLARANAWYERFFGRPADNNPMPVLVEWRAVDTGWVQVFVDEERAGRTQLNFAVDDLAEHIRTLGERGIAVGPVQDVNKGVQVAPVDDPDGNTITLIGNFRDVY